MGLGWFIVYWKWRALRTGDEKYNQAARFWAKIFGLNFAVGVVTGIPMEFQFGTNWAGFSKYAGGVIGQTLAMEGMFAFFLESAFVGALIWGEKRLHSTALSFLLAAVAVATGSWLSGYFILVTNAFMQHPVGYQIQSDGTLGIQSLSAYLLESLGVGTGGPQPNGRTGNGFFCDCRHGRAIYVAGNPSGPGQALSHCRHVRRAGRGSSGCFSHRRSAGEDGRTSSTRHARCDGRQIRGR